MNAMLARDRYPRAGDVAVLCEGDVAGFDVDLIEKWVAEKAPLVLADVWACGTQDSIYGVADAIGRARPLVVVEDRDYRTREQASVDCKAKQKDRLKRAAKVQDWRSWERNEIENYLIEPAVVVPVVAHYFRIDDQELVRARLESVVTCLSVDQAAQYALYQFRHGLPSKNRYMTGLPKKKARPSWNPQQRALVAPEPAAVKNALWELLKKSAEDYVNDGQGINAEQPIRQFEVKCRDWNDDALSSSIWLVDWAGKDILIFLCRWLAGEFGLFDPNGNQRHLVEWDKLACTKTPDGFTKDMEVERQIIQDIQPKLVECFLEQLPTMGGDVQREWESLVEVIRHAANA
ncbi:MAG: hypothetical protein WCB27_23545 [Thermoguttaceae bacterium]